MVLTAAAAAVPTAATVRGSAASAVRRPAIAVEADVPRVRTGISVIRAAPLVSAALADYAAPEAAVYTLISAFVGSDGIECEIGAAGKGYDQKQNDDCHGFSPQHSQSHRCWRRR